MRQGPQAGVLLPSLKTSKGHKSGEHGQDTDLQNHKLQGGLASLPLRLGTAPQSLIWAWGSIYATNHDYSQILC